LTRARSHRARPSLRLGNAATVALCGLLFVAAGKTETPPNPQTTLPDPRWEPLLKLLGSPDYSQRQQGWAQLEKIPAESIETVRTLAGREADPEVKASLQRRVRGMETYLALHPKPLTIKVKNATLAEVVKAINREAGLPLLSESEFAPANDPLRFSLDLDHVPFWEIYKQLNLQHPVSIDSARQPLKFIHGVGMPGLEVVDSSALVRGQVLSGTKTVVANGNVVRQVPIYIMRVAIIPDPRIRLLEISRELVVTQARDDLGVDVTPEQPETAPQLNAINPVALGLQAMSSANLDEPNIAATKISSLKGFVRATVATKVRTVTIENVEQHLNEPIDIPGGTLSIRQVNRNQGSVQLVPVISRNPIRSDQNSSRGPPDAMITVTDQAGTVVSAITIAAQRTSMSIRGGARPGPLKVDICIPLETQEVQLPVELKDIPLPPRRVIQLVR
jgi:hypothetical protein